MDKCSYTLVDKEIEEEVKLKDKKHTWKPLFRQIIVCSGICNAGFVSGLGCGSPTVIIPQLRKENSTGEIDDESASWLYSVVFLAAIPCFILPIISGKIGRKYPFFVVAIITFVSYIGLYSSRTPIQILISEILMAPLLACQITISMSMLMEYTSLKYRGVFLALPAASGNWGMWVANSLGTFFHWKTIAITGIVCSLYNLLTVLYWCESPSWLASKNRYEECIKSHRWIKGENIESEMELKALIRSCKEYEEKNNLKKTQKYNFLVRSFRSILDKSFYMPILLSVASISLIHTSGKVVCSIYAIDIIKKITSSESTAYTGMLLLDAVTVIAMYVGSGISRYIKRRPLFLIGAAGGAIFNIILACYLYLCKLKIIEENHYISLTLLAMVYLFISVGPMVACFTIYAEIIPMRHRTAGMFITGIWMDILIVIILKTAPQTFMALELHGVFLFYGVITLFIVLFLYKLLPETKDKTVQEIEEFFVEHIRIENLLEDNEK